MKPRSFFTAALSAMLLHAVVFPAAGFGAEDDNEVYPVFADVQAVHDRDYLPELLRLIDFARETIDVSQESLQLTYVKPDPLAQVIEALVQSTKRGVRVRVFLNTFSREGVDPSLFLKVDVLAYLRRNGIEVHFVHPRFHLQDRLIIVDARFVMEGGPPWTREGFYRVLGSASVIESDQIAQHKTGRLELLPLWDEQVRREEQTVGTLPVPVYLMTDFKYYPAMADRDDGEALRLHLALLKDFFQTKTLIHEVSLEAMAHQTAADRSVEGPSLIFYAVKILKRLESRYGLIKILDEDVDRITLELVLQGDFTPAVGVPLTFFDENYVKDLSAAGIYSYLVILSRFQGSGDAPVWIGSAYNVSQDFPLREENFRRGVRELRQLNLIEIFPFAVRNADEYRGPQIHEFRYMVNPIASLSEKLRNWSRLREASGDEAFLNARQVAEILGEPEDPEVVLALIQLLGDYRLEDVRSLAQQAAVLPPQSTPETLSYLESRLRHETQRTFQLAIPQ